MEISDYIVFFRTKLKEDLNYCQDDYFILVDNQTLCFFFTEGEKREIKETVVIDLKDNSISTNRPRDSEYKDYLAEVLRIYQSSSIQP